MIFYKKILLGMILAIVSSASMAENYHFVQKISGLSKPGTGVFQPTYNYGRVTWYRAYLSIDTAYRAETTAIVMANTPYVINDNATTTFIIDEYGKLSVITDKSSYGKALFNGYVFKFLDKQVVGVKDNTGNVEFSMRALSNRNMVPSLDLSQWRRPSNFASSTPIGSATIEFGN